MALSGFGKSGSTGFTFSSSPFKGVKSSSEMTQLQLLQMLHAREQKPSRSFVQNLKQVGKEAFDPVLWTFDKLLRPSYAINEMLRRDAAAPDSNSAREDLGVLWGGLKGGFTGRNKTGFGDVLKEAGALEGHGRLRGAAGFVGDVALDPLTFLTMGTSVAAKGATQAATTAGKRVLADGVETVSKKEASRALQLLKPELETLRHAGPEFAERKALAELKRDMFSKSAFGAPIEAAERQALSIARAGAYAEQQAAPRILTVGFGKKLRAETPIPVPSMEKVARIPVLGAGVGAVGKAFTPGYGDRIGHAKLMTRKHSGERLADDYIKFATAQFEGVSHLSDEAQRKALHFFEKKGGVVEDGAGGFVLNPKRIEEARQAGVDEAGIQFAEATHRVSKFLHGEHRRHGIKLENLNEQGKLYVPHMYTRDGLPIQGQHRNMLSEKGFVKNRKHEFSVYELDRMVKNGALPKGVETSPYRLITHNIRASANQHADQTLLKHVAGVYGTPSRLVDKAALKESQSKLDNALKRVGEHPGAAEDGYTAHVEGIYKKWEDRVKEEFHAAHLNDNDLIKKHLEGEWGRTTMATLTRISKRNEGRQAALAQKLTQIRKGEHPGVKKELKAAAKQRAKEVEEYAALEKEVKALQKATNKILKGKKNEGGELLVEVPGMLDEFGHPVRLPQQVAEPILRLKKVMGGDDEVIEAFGRQYRRWMGKWKVGVTSVNPGYGVRNTLSDAWNMYLSGVPLHAMPGAGAKAARIMRAAKDPSHKGHERAVNYLLDAYDSGVLAGLFQGDVQVIEAMIRNSGSKKALIKNKRFLALFTKSMGDINRNRENWGRLTHYVYRRDQGAGVSEASNFVKMAHFDYEDLTDFEVRWMKAVAPFYTWSRKNIPFQIKAIFQAPGRMATFPKAASALEGEGGEGDIVPDYLSEGMAIKIGGKYVNPAIGITDLNKVNPANALDTISSLVTPAAKVPFEIMANKSMLSGRPIVDKSGHPRNPANDALAPLLSLLPGANPGQTKRGDATGFGIDPRWSYVFGQLPFTNWAVNQQGKVKKQQTGSLKRLGYLTGISAQDISQEQQKVIASLNERDEFKGFLRGLRDEGLIPEPERRNKSKAQKTLDEILYAQLEGR